MGLESSLASRRHRPSVGRYGRYASLSHSNNTPSASSLPCSRLPLRAETLCRQKWRVAHRSCSPSLSCPFELVLGWGGPRGKDGHWCKEAGQLYQNRNLAGGMLDCHTCSPWACKTWTDSTSSVINVRFVVDVVGSRWRNDQQAPTKRPSSSCSHTENGNKTDTCFTKS